MSDPAWDHILARFDPTDENASPDNLETWAAMMERFADEAIPAPGADPAGFENMVVAMRATAVKMRQVAQEKRGE